MTPIRQAIGWVTVRPSVRGAALVFVAVGLAAALAACGSDESTGGGSTTTTDADALTVAQLLDQQPDDEVVVRGGLYAAGLEYFGPEGASWEYDVELCDELSVSGVDLDQVVTCEGESVPVPDEVADLDLAWEFFDVNSQYAADVLVRGRLTGGEFVVSEVTDAGGPTPVTGNTETSSVTSPTTGTRPDEPLPLDQLEGEDLFGLRDYARANEIIYLAEEGYVDRVGQLRANCETVERLQEVLDNLSGRGSAAPQDYVAQHAFVCPDAVADLQVVEGVTVPDS